MSYFYQDGRLKIGTPERFADVAELVRSEAGPVYLYDLDNIRARFEALEKSFVGHRHTIHYAMKANSHPSILRLLASLGAGVDTVSGGEIRQALGCGFKPEHVIFSGVAKTIAELEFAIQAGIKQINVESPQELERIGQVADHLDRTADVAFRINPDVNPQTHPYITTGFRENKFGMDASFIPELVSIMKKWEGRLRLRGLTMHIGSQIFDLDVIREAIDKTTLVHQQLVHEGFAIDRLDIGGGLGIHYETEDENQEFEMMRAYGELATDRLKGLDVEILNEPGRVLVARAGLLVGEVQYVKRTSADAAGAEGKQFVILDTGMHHLIRPALYGARHRILPVALSAGANRTYDIVGPICESSDFLAKAVSLPEIAQGDLIGIADSGAYGYAMASRYNAQDLPREIAVVSGEKIR